LAKGKVVINEDRCKGCELCTTVCPHKILALDPKKINKLGYHPVTLTDPEECIGCALCARMCPDCVIEVYRE
jgi:2-oxoglutarate ferredoxin oxidoreductase subunit delta